MDERTLNSRHPWTGRRIRVRVDEVERADGHRTTREIVEHPGAVAIVAWDGEQLAMVRQWRHATGEVLLEIPAGTLEPDEPPIETARRELAEEVGLDASTWVDGPRFFTAPGFCDELMYLYFATDLSDADGASKSDPDEVLEASWLTLADALAAIDDGRIRDANTIVGIEWLARRLPLLDAK
ncbi:MAG: NUDIX hydrolase [Candidatus Limnocylindria bacterium]